VHRAALGSAGVQGGTESSNLLCSSGESAANSEIGSVGSNFADRGPRLARRAKIAATVTDPADISVSNNPATLPPPW
jgi:hypothetical protein